MYPDSATETERDWDILIAGGLFWNLRASAAREGGLHMNSLSPSAQ